MASRVYCSSVAEELEFWSGRLHELSRKIDSVPSIDKYRLLPHIEELHILMTLKKITKDTPITTT